MMPPGTAGICALGKAADFAKPTRLASKCLSTHQIGEFARPSNGPFDIECDSSQQRCLAVDSAPLF